MKTIKIRFSPKYAEQVGILLYSIELRTLVTWSEEGLLDDTTITVLLKLNDSNNAISPELQIEKLREKSFIKFV